MHAYLGAACGDLHAVCIDGLLNEVDVPRAEEHHTCLAKFFQERQQLCLWQSEAVDTLEI